MAISVGVHSIGSALTTATTAAVTTQVSGSTFVLFSSFRTADTVSSIGDSKGNTYTLIANTSAGANNRGVFYRCENGVGGTTHTANITTSTAHNVTLEFLEIIGAAAASFDSGSAVSIADTSSPFTVTSNTLAQAAELLVACISGDSGSNPATLAESTGFTIQEHEDNGFNYWPSGLATKIVASTSAVTPSFTQTGSTQTAVFIAGFKEAAAATLAIPVLMAQYRQRRN